MARYCVNRNAQPNGDHEVHNLDTCWTPPAPANRIDLGTHSSCVTAVATARARFPGARINGCVHCSPSCHTG